MFYTDSNYDDEEALEREREEEEDDALIYEEEEEEERLAEEEQAANDAEYERISDDYYDACQREEEEEEERIRNESYDDYLKNTSWYGDADDEDLEDMYEKDQMRALATRKAQTAAVSSKEHWIGNFIDLSRISIVHECEKFQPSDETSPLYKAYVALSGEDVFDEESIDIAKNRLQEITDPDFEDRREKGSLCQVRIAQKETPTRKLEDTPEFLELLNEFLDRKIAGFVVIYRTSDMDTIKRFLQVADASGAKKTSFLIMKNVFNPRLFANEDKRIWVDSLDEIGKKGELFGICYEW